MKRAAAVLLAGLALGGCGKVAEKEPNDHFTEATPVPPNSTVTGTISSPSDVDMFRLDVAQDSGVLSAHVGGIRDVDFALGILDKDRQELKRFDETGAGGDEEALDVGVHKGTYYVVLSNKNLRANNPKQPYTLRLKFESSQGREMEPNDKALFATPIVCGGVTRGHYFPTQNLLSDDPDHPEEDWFLVEVPSAGPYVLNVDVSEVPKVDPVLEVYDVNSYKLKEIDTGGVGEAESLRNFGVRGPAKIYLRLRAKQKLQGNPDVPYEMLTELLPYQGADEFEPNDQRLEATPLDKTSIRGTISPAGDKDWYRSLVQSSTRQILSANVSGLSGMDLQLDFTDDLGNALLHIDNLGKDQAETLTGMGVTNGTYYLVVSEKTGKKADARQNYVLTTTVVPFQEGLEYELNDSSKTAQSIKVGDSVDGYLAPKGDVDWYEFNVYKKGLVVFEATGVLNVDWRAALFDQDYRELQSAAAKKPGEPLSFTRELDAGTYWLRLQAAAPDQNNVRDKYTLRLRVQ